MRKTVLALCAAVISVGPARAYSDDQLRLAGQLGAAIALARTCQPAMVPTNGVKRILVANGLGEADLADGSAFRERMDRQAGFVLSAKQMMAEDGKPAIEVATEACRDLILNFGPNGIVVPGVLD